MRVAILGGSSPFTISLVEALCARSAALPGLQLVLHGRDEVALGRVALYARARLAALGWRVEQTTAIESAVEAADVVVQQIRFGDLAGRAADEQLAERLGVPGDETLGVAALRRVLRLSRRMRELGRRLAAVNSKALVLNLSNPLSLCTGILQSAGVERVLGVCELPWTTARDAARELGAGVEGLEWTYAGLNHRGFVVELRSGGRDLLAEAAARAGGPRAALVGIDLETIAGLGALPTKYFSLFTDPARHVTAGRARQLAGIRARILDQLGATPLVLPAALNERMTDWYAEAVVPLLEAHAGRAVEHLVVDRVEPDGAVREHRARATGGAIEVVAPRADLGRLATWLGRFERHEAALRALLAEPSVGRLEVALHADPVVPETAVAGALAALTPDLIHAAEAAAT